MTSPAIYIVDDEETIQEGITMALEGDCSVKSFSSAETAIASLKTDLPDLILLDIGLPGMNGMDALSRIKTLYPELPVIMITAYEDISTVISAMKMGAYDYIVKPLHMDGLEVAIKNALETKTLWKEVKNLQERYIKENIPCFIGESNVIHDMMEFIERVSASPDTPILILGETGTGKELVAKAIHYRSPNFKGPLISVNCAAIPKDLIESELFGYERGAFSGACSSGKKGLIEASAGGTLFLDEVGDLGLEAQAKLLRFLEAGEFYRVGGTRILRVRTRVVSATNKNIEKMIGQDLFRKDLYFRLGVIRVQIPSLNERPDDIIPLALHFLHEFNRKFNKKFADLSSKTRLILKTYNWLGNVRELKNLIERGVLTGKGLELTPDDLGIDETGRNKDVATKNDQNDFPPIPPEGIDFPALEKSLERFYIEEAFRMADGNESKAAEMLNLNHHTYRYRRKKLQDE
jgi:two-component system response regulator AtoC